MVCSASGAHVAGATTWRMILEVDDGCAPAGRRLVAHAADAVGPGDELADLGHPLATSRRRRLLVEQTALERRATVRRTLVGFRTRGSGAWPSYRHQARTEAVTCCSTVRLPAGSNDATILAGAHAHLGCRRARETCDDRSRTSCGSRCSVSDAKVETWRAAAGVELGAEQLQRSCLLRAGRDRSVSAWTARFLVRFQTGQARARGSAHAQGTASSLGGHPRRGGREGSRASHRVLDWDCSGGSAEGRRKGRRRRTDGGIITAMPGVGHAVRAMPATRRRSTSPPPGQGLYWMDGVSPAPRGGLHRVGIAHRTSGMATTGRRSAPIQILTHFSERAVEFMCGSPAESPTPDNGRGPRQDRRRRVSRTRRG